jgi:hypothetical protein
MIAGRGVVSGLTAVGRTCEALIVDEIDNPNRSWIP